MDVKLRRYYQLKQKQKELEQELSELRGQIIEHCQQQGVQELEAGTYRAKLVLQDRKEFDEQKLYEALPDPDVWRLLSKPDASKIAGLIKLNVISEDAIKDTYAAKRITILQVEKNEEGTISMHGAPRCRGVIACLDTSFE